MCGWETHAGTRIPGSMKHWIRKKWSIGISGSLIYLSLSSISLDPC